MLIQCSLYLELRNGYSETNEGVEFHFFLVFAFEIVSQWLLKIYLVLNNIILIFFYYLVLRVGFKIYLIKKY